MIDVTYIKSDGTEGRESGQCLEIVLANVEDESGTLVAAKCVFVGSHNLGSVDNFQKVQVTGRAPTLKDVAQSYGWKPLDKEGDEQTDQEAPDHYKGGGRGLKDNREF